MYCIARDHALYAFTHGGVGGVQFVAGVVVASVVYVLLMLCGRGPRR